MLAGGGASNSPQHQQADIDLEQVLKSESARAPFHVGI